MLDQSYYAKADEILDRFGRKPSALIPIMQEIQGAYRYLPEELLSYVAEKIGVTEANAFSVATFYENFSLKPKGKYIIRICDGTACHVKHSIPILNALKEKLESIRAAVESLEFPEYPGLRITVSIGGAHAVGRLADAVQKADQALYRAKTTKNRAALYKEAPHDHS